jgi:FkbM family methyltransferase
VAFEPSVRELCRLYRNLALNDAVNVIVVPFALASEPGTGELMIADNGNAGMNSVRPLEHVVSRQRCTFVRLDDVLSADLLDQVRLIKIDVEGAELEVLRGMDRYMSRLQRATFVVEITHDYLVQLGASVADIYGFFDRHGYRPEFNPANSVQYDEVFRRRG